MDTNSLIEFNLELMESLDKSEKSYSDALKYLSLSYGERIKLGLLEKEIETQLNKPEETA